MKRLITLILSSWLLFAAGGASATIILSTGDGSWDKATVGNLTLGNNLTFDYMFSEVTFTTGPWIGINATILPPEGFPAGQFNESRLTETAGWMSALIDTTFATGFVRDVAFTANTFGQVGNSAVVTIARIAIDGQPLYSVPEPTALLLLGAGLAGLGFVSIMKSKS